MACPKYIPFLQQNILIKLFFCIIFLHFHQCIETYSKKSKQQKTNINTVVPCHSVAVCVVLGLAVPFP